MSLRIKIIVGALVASVGLLPLAAHADVDTRVGINTQEGDNDGDNDQGGSSQSGDIVAGQVTGTVASGDTSVDATNTSEDVDLVSGDASAQNSASVFTGLNATGSAVVASDVFVGNGYNVQEGDNASAIVQEAEAVTGDGVGGQVIGVVTSAGGSADVVAANTSQDVDVDTGDAEAENDAAAFTGHSDISDVEVVVLDIIETGNSPFVIGVVHEGDNDYLLNQSAAAASGDGVGGQVLGVVSAGDTSVDATNDSQDIDIDTGEADASNDAAAFVGSTIGFEVDVVVDDVFVNNTFNAQEGDNAGEITQAATASTGDGIGGQVVGAVTSSRGTADIVAANASDDVDVDTGDAEAENEGAAFVGQSGLPLSLLIVGTDIISLNAFNVQEGDNDLAADQTADASTGDGVGGQVLGVVSAGDASVDATNATEDADIDTGDGSAENAFAAFVGQSTSQVLGVPSDVSSEFSFNVQEGGNAHEVVQAAMADTGDAVAGQVQGVVTSAGGSADLVLANTSIDAAVETGDGDVENEDASFTGLTVDGEVPIF